MYIKWFVYPFTYWKFGLFHYLATTKEAVNICSHVFVWDICLHFSEEWNDRII